MKYVIGIIGLIVVLGLAWITSTDKKKVKYRPVVVMVILQFILGFVLLNTGAGNFVVGGIANGFEML
uniref:Na+ dependent nucleoside transporter N-terminal domain-containing protein n=1 Tax=uncultured Clostridium sp. TaxID=59620 RepID=UPI0026230345